MSNPTDDGTGRGPAQPADGQRSWDGPGPDAPVSRGPVNEPGSFPPPAWGAPPPQDTGAPAFPPSATMRSHAGQEHPTPSSRSAQQPSAPTAQQQAVGPTGHPAPQFPPPTQNPAQPDSGAHTGPLPRIAGPQDVGPQAGQVDPRASFPPPTGAPMPAAPAPAYPAPQPGPGVHPGASPQGSGPQAYPPAPAPQPAQQMPSAPQGQNAPKAPEHIVQAARVLGEAIAQVQRVIVGQEHMVEQLMVGLLAKGHILLEGVPGVAKTLAVRSFATVVGGEFARIQFTPDLVPSDIVGTRIYRASQEGFDIELGPVFVNFVLADEINRAPAKVQSAMLELMAEKQVSIAGKTYPAKKPFIVIATQNPVESEGVYPLPEAQRDRFLLKVDVPYPRGNEEFEILRRMSVSPPDAKPILDPAKVIELQDLASNVFVHNLVAEYIVRLVLATRTPAEFGLPDLEPVIQIGCSPRATLGLVAAARALALIHGRDYVLPTDVQAVARDVMAHRLVLGFDAVADNISAANVIERVLAVVPPPTPVWNAQQRQVAHQQHRHQPEYQQPTR